MKRSHLLAALVVGTSVLAAGAHAQQAPAQAAPPAAAPQAAQEPATLGEKAGKILDTITGKPQAKADTDMRRVLDAHADLKPQPIEKLAPADARKQPSVADAVKALLRKEGKSDAPEPGVTTKDITIPGPGGEIQARVYTPEGAAGQPLPVVVYYHGGGWVIADLDTYDATPRAMAKQTGAIVVSSHYRQAPENKFPAAHDDAFAAYQWVVQNAQTFGGDPKRVAVMGESAGGNLAINVAIQARDRNVQRPVHEVLVYPVAGVNMETPSYNENDDAKPLNKPMMGWFVTHVTNGPDDKNDPRLDLVGKANLKDLPPTTVITAEIDPLRSEGQMLAQKLKEAGVQVNARDYIGVTHEFFGMGAVVAKAKEAQALAAQDLKAALAPQATGSTGTPAQPAKTQP